MVVGSERWRSGARLGGPLGTFQAISGVFGLDLCRIIIWKGSRGGSRIAGGWVLADCKITNALRYLVNYKLMGLHFEFFPSMNPFLGWEGENGDSGIIMIMTGWRDDSS